ncbi:MAG: glutathione S-transferase family protein [Rhodospirillales bacterium]|nr:glutathione S-transferase family protein [Alphaproteobacteria bacterium]MBL6947618.1 glutathione S-transferase family protein [Rhodospirillales bacterium]
MLKLYGLPGACPMAVHIILEHLGVDYEMAMVDRDLLTSPEHLAVNPMGQAPSLETEEGLITESVAMLLHIDERYGQGRVSPPPGSWERARMMMLLMFMASQEHPAFSLWLRPFRWLEGEAEQEELRESARKRFAVCLERLNGWLEGRDWLIGDGMTLADPLALVHIRWGLRVTPPSSDYANLWRFAQRMVEVPAVKKVMADEGVKLAAE